MPQNHIDQVVLARRLESSVTVNLHGGAVTSMVMNGVEHLFLSKATVFDNKAPIRSGIAVILSQDPIHDFFRTSHWSTLIEQKKQPNGDVTASFVLEDDEKTRKQWDQKFKAILKVSLKKREIAFDFSLENKDSKPLTCAPMLQNHFLVDDVTTTSVLGLQEVDSADEIQHSISRPDAGERVSIDGPMNRIYRNTAVEHVLKNTQDGASLFLRKLNLPDTEIWNPWDENKNGTAHDVADDEYTEMVCLGCGHVTHNVTLDPGATFQASQSFIVE